MRDRVYQASAAHFCYVHEATLAATHTKPNCVDQVSILINPLFYWLLFPFHTAPAIKEQRHEHWLCISNTWFNIDEK